VREEELGATNPAPRGMDSLDVRLTPDAARLVDDPAHPGQKKPDVLVAVKYQNFRQGAEEKIVKG
jgi:hypothetical protein